LPRRLMQSSLHRYHCHTQRHHRHPPVSAASQIPISINRRCIPGMTRIVKYVLQHVMNISHLSLDAVLSPALSPTPPTRFPASAALSTTSLARSAAGQVSLPTHTMRLPGMTRIEIQVLDHVKDASSHLPCCSSFSSAIAGIPSGERSHSDIHLHPPEASTGVDHN
jgi:hypothetical protein